MAKAERARPRMLSLEIEYLNGVSYATSEAENAQGDWPPQPARVFSALVASWAARGQRDDERAALEWLERQPPPLIEASDAIGRTSVTAFVPINDAKTGSGGNVSVMPSRRGRQPRRFPAVRPNDPVVRILWPDEPSGETLHQLDAIARDVPYVGHSTSLTRMRFSPGIVSGNRRVSAAHRTVYAGRLAELVRAYERGERPSPGMPVMTPSAAQATISSSVFDSTWIVLAHGTGWRPAAQTSGVAAKRLRDALMAVAGQDGDAIPEWLSGHRLDGSPSRLPHLAFVPLLDVGWEHSTGNMMGLAIVPPRFMDDSARRALDDMVRALMRLGDHYVRLQFAQDAWLLEPIDDSDRPSLDPRRWRGLGRDGTATRWATVSPIVLDRHPKARDAEERQAEVQAGIANACERIGLPRPARVVADKHSAVRAAVSAYPSGNAPAWTGWRLSLSLRGRPLVHATVEFAEPVRGPVILGAGRFVGLGLCLPLLSRFADEVPA